MSDTKDPEFGDYDPDDAVTEGDEDEDDEVKIIEPKKGED